MVVERVTIKNASDRLIACVLSDLTGFSGATLSRSSNRYHPECGARDCAIIFSHSTLESCGGDNPHLLGPDIVVARVYNLDGKDNNPTDDYIVDYGGQVDLSLIEKQIMSENYDSIRTRN